MKVNRKVASFAVAIGALLSVALTSSVFAVGVALDATDELGQMKDDLLATFALNSPVIIIIGLALIALWAGVNQVFHGGKKAANKKS